MSRMSSLKRRQFGLGPIQALSVGDQLIEETFTTSTFDITFTPSGAVCVFLNGLLQRQGHDYSKSGTTITMDDFRSGDVIQCIYLVLA